jgi:uncharacterized radical SAM protein YgiQ
VARKADDPPESDWALLPSHEAIEADPKLLMEATLTAERLVHQGGRPIFQASGARAVLVNPPAEPLTTAEMDFLYQLPFTRKAHPAYQQPVPALNVLAASLTTHRGCGGACSFCSLALHQGRRISSRSLASIVGEAERLAAKKPVALSDVGAPTANLWGAECAASAEKCFRKSCLWPKICPQLKADQSQWVMMLKAVAKARGVKQVRVASGVRYDLALTDEKSLREFLQNYVGGQLKVAPEHLDPTLLKLMRKPGPEVFEKFLRIFEQGQGRAATDVKKIAKSAQPQNRSEMAASSPRYLIPYLISAFPGSGTAQMGRLREWLQKRSWRPRQVQAFIPTPGTVATAMFYGKVDEDGNLLEVAADDRRRLEQHALLAPSEKKVASRRN